MPASYSVVNGNLRINSVKKSEEGFYVCIASNVQGYQQAEAKITVNGEEIRCFLQVVLRIIMQVQ